VPVAQAVGARPPCSQSVDAQVTTPQHDAPPQTARVKAVGAGGGGEPVLAVVVVEEVVVVDDGGGGGGGGGTTVLLVDVVGTAAGMGRALV
jgi:hypothetical protein